jgi:Phosphodiester glycosidase
VLRPASRRASQRSASPHGDDPAPYEHDPYAQNGAARGPDGAPYGPDPSPYRPDPSPYRPDASPYRRDPPPYGPDRPTYGPNPSPYGPNPSPYGPDRPTYGPDPSRYGPDSSPYGPDPYPPDASPYRPDPSPYGPNPSPNPSPYGPDPYLPGSSGYRPDPSPYGPDSYRADLYPPGTSPYGQPSPSDPQPYDETLPPGDGDGGYSGPPPGRRGPGRRGRRGRDAKGRGRVRRLLRRPSVRVILALIAVLCCWLAFSIGQALTAPGGGSLSTKLAEWARDHYLGPVVTFGEWLTYSPPKVGGKPAFSFAVPKGTQQKFKHVRGFQPIIPPRLSSPAGAPLPGEGVWRVLETVKGEPAIFGTFLRVDAVHTSYASGIVSMDQRLVSFQLRPGSEDPGPGNWHAQPWIPPGTRAGLLATFNGGFKLDSSGGGFYLNGSYRGTLTDGAASVVYYRNGTIKIGVWGQDVRMTPDVVGVRQNLRLIVDHGNVPASVNQDVLSSWGATLGGGYYVWRSGLGITRDGRVIFVYGDRLDVQDLADLLQRAGAVEALQLDINPEWMSYDYYKVGGHPSDPTPVNLLPDQQATPYRYYSVYSRDFTAVYAR